MPSHIWMKVCSKLPYEELQIKFDFRHGWQTFSWAIALWSKFVFRTFLGYAFTYLNKTWLKAFISRITVQVWLLSWLTYFFMIKLLSFVQNSFSGLFLATLFHILMEVCLPNLTFYQIARGFHRTFATGAACQQRTLTPLDTWSYPTLGLASGLMLRPISPELVLFPDCWVSNIPRYFCFSSVAN